MALITHGLLFPQNIAVAHLVIAYSGYLELVVASLGVFSLKTGSFQFFLC